MFRLINIYGAMGKQYQFNVESETAQNSTTQTLQFPSMQQNSISLSFVRYVGTLNKSQRRKTPRDIRLRKRKRLKETIEFNNKLKFKALHGLRKRTHVFLNPYTNRIIQRTTYILNFIIFVHVICSFYAYSYSHSKIQ